MRVRTFCLQHGPFLPQAVVLIFIVILFVPGMGDSAVGIDAYEPNPTQE